MCCDTYTYRNRNAYRHRDANSNPESDSTAFPKPNARCHSDTYLNTDGKRDAGSDASGAGHQPLDKDASSNR